MKASLATAAVLVAGSIAAPAAVIKFGPGHHVVDSICPAPHGSKGPLPIGFPLTNMLGSVIGPLLDQTVGAATIEDIDRAADQLCVSAQQNGEGDGICQDTLAAARDFVDAKTDLDKAKQFGCLLDYICISHTGPQDHGLCNQLLAGADCIANRIVKADDPECTK